LQVLSHALKESIGRINILQHGKVRKSFQMEVRVGRATVQRAALLAFCSALHAATCRFPTRDVEAYTAPLVVRCLVCVARSLLCVRMHMTPLLE
jgi:hypothetical protein